MRRGPGTQAQLLLPPQRRQLRYLLSGTEEGETSGLFACKDDVGAKSCPRPSFVRDSHSKNMDGIRSVLHKVIYKQLRSHLAQLLSSLCSSRGPIVSSALETLVPGTTGSTTVQGKATEETEQPLPCRAADACKQITDSTTKISAAISQGSFIFGFTYPNHPSSILHQSPPPPLCSAHIGGGTHVNTPNSHLFLCIFS